MFKLHMLYSQCVPNRSTRLSERVLGKVGSATLSIYSLYMVILYTYEVRTKFLDVVPDYVVPRFLIS